MTDDSQRSGDTDRRLNPVEFESMTMDDFVYVDPKADDLDPEAVHQSMEDAFDFLKLVAGESRRSDFWKASLSLMVAEHKHRQRFNDRHDAEGIIDAEEAIEHADIDADAIVAELEGELDVEDADAEDDSDVEIDLPDPGDYKYLDLRELEPDDTDSRGRVVR